MASLVAQMVKSLPAMREIWVRSLVFLPGESPWKRGKLGRLQSMGSQRVRHNWATKHRDSSSLLVTVHSSGFLGSSEEKKNPPAVQETQIRPLGQKDSLKKEMATHSSILAWRTPWTEEPGGL